MFEVCYCFKNKWVMAFSTQCYRCSSFTILVKYSACISYQIFKNIDDLIILSFLNSIAMYYKHFAAQKNDKLGVTGANYTDFNQALSCDK